MLKKRTYIWFILFNSSLLVPFFAYPQNTSDAKTPVEKEDAQSTPQETTEINIPGDVIIFTTGKKMVGVQVLRELPDKIEVQTKEGLDPVYLPRQFIKEIIYDEIDPLREKRMKELGIIKQPPQDVIPGEELSQEFNQKMRAPLSDQPITYQNTGFPKMLTELSNKVGVKIEFDEAIKNIPMPERIKNFEIPPGTSFYKFLQTDFANAFPNISVTFKYDTIYVAIKNPSSVPSTPNPSPKQ